MEENVLLYFALFKL